jgi:hypothetical protein
MRINILRKWCSGNIQAIKAKQAVQNLTLDTNIILSLICESDDEMFKATYN